MANFRDLKPASIEHMGIEQAEDRATQKIALNLVMTTE
jgi:hypothetical protein